MYCPLRWDAHASTAPYLSRIWAGDGELEAVSNAVGQPPCDVRQREGDEVGSVVEDNCWEMYRYVSLMLMHEKFHLVVGAEKVQNQRA